jgi:lipopolysaccharide assembly outer membrane protein LptD (OstA)
MKNILTTTMALLALTVAAHATDLPSKAKAPAAPAPVAAAPAASNDSLSIGYTYDQAAGFGSQVDNNWGMTYTHQLGGGFSAGVNAGFAQKTDNSINGTMEGQAGYKLPAFSGVSVGGKVALGERWISTGDFPYYAVYGSADYAVGSGITLNAIQYRWRSAIDSNTYGFQSHQIGTGVTYDITSNYSVNAKVFRNYDTTGNNTGDGFAAGLTIKF